MSKIKDYSIIETEWIKSQIRFLKHQQKLKNYEDEKINFKLEYLTSLAEKLKPLTPIVENAFQDARKFDSLDGPVDIDVVLSFGGDMSDLSPRIANSEDYINNTIIE